MPIKIGNSIKKFNNSFKYFSAPFLRHKSKVFLFKIEQWQSDEVIIVPVLKEFASCKAISPKRVPLPSVATFEYENIFKLYWPFSSSSSSTLSLFFSLSFISKKDFLFFK